MKFVRFLVCCGIANMATMKAQRVAARKLRKILGRVRRVTSDRTFQDNVHRSPTTLRCVGLTTLMSVSQSVRQ